MSGTRHPAASLVLSRAAAADPMGERAGRVATRRCRLLSSAALTCVVLAAGQAPLPAAAQCNASGSPAPPPASQSSIANQTFSYGSPAAPYPRPFNSGTRGCDGPSASFGNPGNPGSPGQPGGAIASTNTALTIIGGPSGDPVPNPAATITSSGGYGGSGSVAPPPTNADQSGGAGAAGGAGGSITATFNAAFNPDPSRGPAFSALGVAADGGSGGFGGDSSTVETLISWARTGGIGGAGGRGGSVSLTASGSVRAESGIFIEADGGAGGNGGNSPQQQPVTNLLATLTGGAAGNGGAGGTVRVLWASGTINASVIGINASAAGGAGGAGGSTGAAAGTQGGNAGAGGAGGQASITVAGGTAVIVDAAGSGATSYPNFGVLVTSHGGSGGAGGLPGGAIGPGGGSGGAGGAAGTANAAILGRVTFSGPDIDGRVDGQAVSVQSNGGSGGPGAGVSGVVGAPGAGGPAGAGGAATLALSDSFNTATIRSSGNFAHGALVQSVGGAGGNGGSASFVFGGGSGGAGAAGGNGGPVTVTAPAGTVNPLDATVFATGRNGVAILAQSVGGGGGAGGDAADISIGQAYVVGGNGGNGGNGGTVDVRLDRGVFASTSTLGGAGVLAQSIGGSGGSGGSASSKGVGFISMVIGGDSGSGATSGNVSVTSGALVTTYGDHAAGIQAQSIGGGGGKAGSAFAFNGGILPTASVSIGGRGGSGGAAGTVSVTNTAQVVTYGADAPGVFIQSIGGGGGSGGAAAARAVALSPTKFIPAVSISVAIGGSGGSGNTGGAASLTNSGLIATAGDGSIGVHAQSVGGGGGAGGDSTAASYSGGRQSGITISVGVSLGGSGGSGGTGGAVTVSNSGLIATLGQDAFGVFAQSVGGGGGSGGGGDATGSASDSKFSLGASISVGGGGGTGGHGGTVGLVNTGSIATRGDGATAIFAQSVGGGGGAGGGGTGSASGGSLAVAVTVGGSGGAGGDGNTATVRNSGNVVTRGTDAIGIMAQSVGGGGGNGGKAGATAGGVTPLSNGQALFDNLSGGLGLNQKTQNLGDGVLQIGQIGENIQATFKELSDLFPQPQGSGSESGSSPQLNVAVSVGGRGGAAGSGGTVSVSNSGTVATFGAQSDGIYAQSVGGGGGTGGGSTSTGAASDDTPAQTAVGVGGRGGGGGNGGAVSVTNTGTILTQGVAAFGVFAQSVGGGGGEAASAGVVSGSFKSLSVGVGGNGGTGGTGGAVTVTAGDGTAASGITTTGKHGIALVAQSVGAGGGLVRTMTTDQTFDPSKILNNPQGRVGDLHGLALNFGGQNGLGGNGGQVQVTVSSPITTGGLGAHGIVAQSIGAGGGLVVGGRVNLQSVNASGNATGDGGAVSVQLRSGATLTTAGPGAYGIIAQSIGGGGGIAGDLSGGPPGAQSPLVSRYSTDTSPTVRPNSGSGGAVSISVTSALVQTTGSYAPAIFAQSIGGGGGLIGYDNPALGETGGVARGTAGGSGAGGAVTVTLSNSRVFAEGTGSAGIFAQSVGRSSGPIRISIDSTSEVRGGAQALVTDRLTSDAAAIRLLGGTGNTIDNAGRITAVADGGTPLAILADTPRSNTVITNTGTITGDVSLAGAAGNLLDNRPGGVVSAPTLLDLGGGLFRNAGALQVGGIGRRGETVLRGDLVQTATGRLVVETDHLGGASDRLTVRGSAELGGVVEVRPVRLANRAVTVLTATGGLALDPEIASNRTPVFRYDVRRVGNGLEVQPRADFGAGGGLGANQRRVAAALQGIWDRGGDFGAGFTALAGLNDAGSYGRALDSLAGQTASAIAAFRHSSSHGFITNMLNDCATFEGAGVTLDEASCAWGRVFGGAATQGNTAGALGYRTTAWNFQAGGQRQVAPGVFLGGTIAYENSQFRGGNGTSRISGDSLLVGGILRFQQGPLQVAGVLDAGYGWYDSKRFVGVGSFGAVARARPEAWHVGAHGRVAYQIPFAGPLGGWYAQPRLDLHLTYVRNREYTEGGAGPFDLAVQAQGGAGFAAVPAVEVGARVRLGEGTVLRPFASAGVGFNAFRDGAATARFVGQGGPGFRATTPIPDVVGKFTLGAELLSSARWDLRVQYSADVGTSYAAHVGMARLAYRF